ncbi:MAG: radical SAM protein [Geobacteraceae bacterium]
MNILLINPQSSSIYNTFGLSLPPIGLLYIAASLEQAGHSVVVRDLAAGNNKLDDRDIRHADLVGISADTTRATRALSIASKASALGRPVVMGGPHPQFMAADIFASNCVDYIVKGEGELIFANLLAALQNQDDIASVKGLIIKDGRHFFDTPAAIPPDVETLPLPARHLVDLHDYQARVGNRATTPIITSRGCPGACQFCSSSSFFGTGWRCRSAKSVLAELDEIYKRYGFRSVCFMDDNFTLSPQRVMEIADGIIERGYDLKFWNFSRVETIAKNPDMVTRMAAAGSTTVYLGIESGNEDTLSALGKNTTTGDVTRAIDILRQNGIESYGSYIIGNLNETAVDVEKTIELAVRLNTNIAQFSILTPYPGTRLYEEIKDRIFCRRWKFYDGLHLVFRHPLINRHYLQILLIKAFVKFYRRSKEASRGFREASSKGRLTVRKVAACAWELFF